MNNFKKFLLFFYLVFTAPIFADGFVAGTFVKTHIGFAPFISIEHIRGGDNVLAHGFDGYCYPEPVIFVGKKVTPILVKLIIGNETILTVPDQYFLKGPEEAWVPAANLQQGDKVLASSGYLTVKSVGFFNESTEIYIISVANRSNFYVSANEILTHNVVLESAVIYEGVVAISSVPAVITFIETAGEVATYVATSIGVWQAWKYFRGNEGAKSRPYYRPTSSGGGNGKPPDDPNDPYQQYSGYRSPFSGNSENDNITRQSNQELIRSQRSLEKVLDEHRTKLQDYQNNPEAYDNMGSLKNAPTDAIREKIIQGRVKHLQGEIASFENKINTVASELLKRGIYPDEIIDK